MQDQIIKAVEILKDGGVVIFPTDTVWGIGAWVRSRPGIERLYQLKKRDPQKPTAVLVGSLAQAREYGRFEEKMLEVVSAHWPGALTAIVPATEQVPREILNNQGGVGIRWPKMLLVERMCRLLPGGIVASSANEAQGDAPVVLTEVADNLLTASDYVIREELPLSGVSSTVVDLTGEWPRVVRQGEVVIGGSSENNWRR